MQRPWQLCLVTFILKTSKAPPQEISAFRVANTLTFRPVARTSPEDTRGLKQQKLCVGRFV